MPARNHTRHEWARWDAYIYAMDPDALFDEFREQGFNVSIESGLTECSE